MLLSAKGAAAFVATAEATHGATVSGESAEATVKRWMEKVRWMEKIRTPPSLSGESCGSPVMDFIGVSDDGKSI